MEEGRGACVDALMLDGCTVQPSLLENLAGDIQECLGHAYIHALVGGCTATLYAIFAP